VWIVVHLPYAHVRIGVFVIQRLQADAQFSAGGEAFRKKYLWQSLTDWKTWLGMQVYMGADGPLYAFSLFAPTIIKQLGYHSTAANLLSVPIYVFAVSMDNLCTFFL
jgi:hypothetical protein